MSTCNDSSAAFSPSTLSPDDWSLDFFRAVEAAPLVDSSNITGEYLNGNYPSNPISSLAGMFPMDDSDQPSLISMNNDYSIFNTYKNPNESFLPVTSLILNQHIHFPFTNTPSSTTQPPDMLHTSSSLSHVSPKKSGSSEPAVKRARIQTPSPLPTFKVRKEKLGDRVTALQQLVSPFGKTDTASVLHEAVEYIKFLHDQVTVLSRPYLKKGSPRLQNRPDEEAGAKQDLSSRGLCLVPISSTFPVTTTADFWTPRASSKV